MTTPTRYDRIAFVASAGASIAATPAVPLLATRAISASGAWTRFNADRNGP